MTSPQRGDDFADRLANAHADSADGYPVLQIGMDTPQVTAELLTDCARRLLDVPPVPGLAHDGRMPAHHPDVSARHGELTLKALRDKGIDVTPVPRLDSEPRIDRASRAEKSPADSRPARPLDAFLADDLLDGRTVCGIDVRLALKLHSRQFGQTRRLTNRCARYPQFAHNLPIVTVTSSNQR